MDKRQLCLLEKGVRQEGARPFPFRVLFILPNVMKKYFQIALLLGVLQIVAYGIAAMSATTHLAIPPPTADSLLYCQSARQIVEGQPFRYTPGESPSTGCTSHLYPFLLAVPYLLGAHGPSLLTAGFLLNAVFYLVFLISWTLSAERIFGDDRHGTMAFAILLPLCANYPLVALTQSDNGAFLALSSALFTALLLKRHALFTGLLVLAPWLRPEGGFLCLAWPVALAIGKWGFCREVRRAEWTSAFLGILSLAFLPLFNIFLTGSPNFQAVANKGYLVLFPLANAIMFSMSDFMAMLRAFFLGQPGDFPRMAYCAPFLTTLLALAGLSLRPWRKDAHEDTVLAFWGVGALLSIACVAQSGWQGLTYDRYLSWCLPLWLLIAISGARILALRIGSAACWLPLVAIGGLCLCGSAYAVSDFQICSLNRQTVWDDDVAATRLLHEGDSIGGAGVSFAYTMEGHRCYHLSGYYTPVFFRKEKLANLEILKHTPDLRFNWWYFQNRDDTLLGTDVSTLATEPRTTSFLGNHLARADWQALDAALRPYTSATNGLRLVDHLDVMHEADEIAHGYETYCRVHGLGLHPFARSGTINGQTIFEVGRAIIGNDTFTVDADRGKPLTIVLRTSASLECPSNGAVPNHFATSFANPLHLQAHIGGRAVADAYLTISTNETDFSDVALTIPGEALPGGPTRITIAGDHAAFAYWFYQ